MTVWIDWIEPFDSEAKYTLYCRLSEQDVIRFQREREPRYTSDEQAVEDFMVIHWATRVVE